MIKHGCCQSGCWNLKGDSISRVNIWKKHIFTCWCTFRKANTDCNDFWVGVIKNMRNHLVH